MKILLYSPSMGVYGGMEAFVLALADWISRQTHHEVRVCFKLVGDGRVGESFRSRVAALSLNVSFAGRANPILLRLCQWADVVHGNNASPDIVLAAKLMRRPLLLTIHNYLRDKVGWRNRLWHFAARRADWRTYNSRFVRGTWENGANWPDSEVVPTVSHLPQLEFPVSERRGFFFAARLIPNKGLDTLVAAYQAARIDKKIWPLVIAGDGPLRQWLEDQIALGSSEGIRYAGFLSEQEKGVRMASSRWLVAPPNTREDMGLTPIEARNVSVPAIVTRDGGLPESGGPSALLCEPGDAVSLRQALEAAAAMSEEEYAARARIAKESLREYLLPMEHYIDLYRNLIARRG